jgi:hypothetical protein
MRVIIKRAMIIIARQQTSKRAIGAVFTVGEV